MIITRTPFRISFAGGGSDLKDYYRNSYGAVLSVSIKKYVYLSAHPYFFRNRYLLKYSQHEYVEDIHKIKHRILNQVFKDYQISGIDFNSSADIPSGTGLASSSAFTVGLINLCNAYTNAKTSMTKEEIARYACEIEIDKLKCPIGKQDQYACAVGGMNYIRFNNDETVIVEKIVLEKEKKNKLQKQLLMFYTGMTRDSADVLNKKNLDLISNQKMINNLHKMVSLAQNLREELSLGNIDSMGDILHSGWMYKKELAPNVSNSKIDHYYDLAIKNGALGGKILGAGAGGFLLFYVKEEKSDNVRRALSDLIELEFEFDDSGTTLIYQE